MRESFFRGEHWLDIAHVQREAIRWVTDVAAQRIHGTLCEKPIVRFEVEKQALGPPFGPAPDPPTWGKCKVCPDHHFHFALGHYSVPIRYVGKDVWARTDRAAGALLL